MKINKVFLKPLWAVGILWMIGGCAVSKLSAEDTAQQASRSGADSGPLVEYIRKADDSFQWTVLDTRQDADLQIFELSMTSQRWSPAVIPSNHPLWQHRMTIYVPTQIQSSSAILHVNGGTRHSRSLKVNERVLGPEITDELDFASLARSTGTVVINLRDIPQQFLALNGEAPRKEDDLIARTWLAALDHPECTDCPLQFPMTKSVVRGMDAVQQFFESASSESLKALKPQQFILTGASKRGWTVWLASAVDPRVQAVIPMVIDVLNVQENLDHLHKVYGNWILPLQPYLVDGQSVLPRLHTPEMDRLMSWVDPWSYKDNLTLPKLVVTAAGDDFFTPDSSQSYWSGLSGPKWMRTYPNSRHYISRENRQRVTDTIISFAGYLTRGELLPEVVKQTLVDTKDAGSKLSVALNQKPDSAELWQVTNPETRDFRMTTLTPMGLEYRATPLDVECYESTCEVQALIDPPEKGWTAWFVSFTYKREGQPDFVINTPVSVLSR